MLKRIPLEKIFSNPDQPRKEFDPDALRELANSIEANGLMQPIVVSPAGDGRFMIVMGERRYRAHCLLWDEGRLEDGSILAHVRRMDEEQIAIQAIVENLQRADLTPLEEARAFQQMLDRGYSEEELAKALGLAQTWRIRERTQLLKLTPEIQMLLAGGQIQRMVATEIAKLEPRDQMKVLRLVQQGRLVSWDNVRNIVNGMLDKEAQSEMFAPAVSEEDVAAMTRLERKVESVAAVTAAGFKNGECVAAVRVSRERTMAMADKIVLIRKHLQQMEQQLRTYAAQGELAMDKDTL